MPDPTQLEDEMLMFDPTEAEGFDPLPNGWFIFRTREVRNKNADGESMTKEVDGKTVRQVSVQCIVEEPAWAEKRQVWHRLDMGGKYYDFTDDFLLAIGFPSVNDAKRKRKTVDPTALAKMRMSDITNKRFASRIQQNPDKNDPSIIYANIVKPVVVSKYNAKGAAIDPTLEFPGADTSPPSE